PQAAIRPGLRRVTAGRSLLPQWLQAFLFLLTRFPVPGTRLRDGFGTSAGDDPVPVVTGTTPPLPVPSNIRSRISTAANSSGLASATFALQSASNDIGPVITSRLRSALRKNGQDFGVRSCNSRSNSAPAIVITNTLANTRWARIPVGGICSKPA